MTKYDYKVAIKSDILKELDRVDAAIVGSGPAKYLKSRNIDMTIGFITPISQHFCETCNRVRLSVDGTLYMCLGQDHSLALRPLLRAGITHEELKDVIRYAINLKPKRHEFIDKLKKVVRFMSMTDG
ncbi:Cyclic pyranopterin phosphate synthase (MoaA) [hydrothermal vent metagenome]|uniref:Cyclic pyranopterin phosphate synthase (MoaA) n=1 Tax=hydrothermal vent metagenome TaxID=652676 RepID=A0A3B1AM83_9ZZZZ